MLNVADSTTENIIRHFPKVSGMFFEPFNKLLSFIHSILILVSSFAYEVVIFFIRSKPLLTAV